MTDDEVHKEIHNLAKSLGIQVTDSQIEQLVGLCRELEGLDTQQLQEHLESIAGTVDSAQKPMPSSPRLKRTFRISLPTSAPFSAICSSKAA